MSEKNNKCVLYYRQLPKLRPEFVRKIRFVSIFGKHGSDVMIVTKDDQVWAVGENQRGCLGVGSDQRVEEPTLIMELSKKKVKKFAFGLKHTLALTSKGKVFSFGYNEFGQLANGTTEDSFVPKPIVFSDVIEEVSCGAFHSLALTRSGQLYSWGFNFWGQLGIQHNIDQSEPNRVLVKEPVIMVSCGHHHSLALTTTGLLYAWGHNAFGQLGIGTKDRFRNIPTRVRVTTEDIMVAKVVCGQNHSLLLTREGALFAFGRNQFNQVGNGQSSDQSSPVRVILMNNNDNKTRFVDIACSMFSNTSTALSNTKRTFIWGQIGDENDRTLDRPVATPLKTMQELFARYNYVTFDAIFLNRKKTFPERVVSLINGMKRRLT